MTKLRYSFGGGAAVRQPCAVCTGAGYECSTEPLERLPVLGGRHTHNDEQNSTGTALAWDKLVADYRLYAEGSGRIAPGGQYRRRVGSCADGGADAETRPHRKESSIQWWSYNGCKPESGWSFRWRPDDRTNRLVQRKGCCDDRGEWRQPTHAHRQQVHGLLYVAAHRLTQKGVAA